MKYFLKVPKIEHPLALWDLELTSHMKHNKKDKHTKNSKNHAAFFCMCGRGSERRGETTPTSENGHSATRV